MGHILREFSVERVDVEVANLTSVEQPLGVVATQIKKRLSQNQKLAVLNHYKNSTKRYTIYLRVVPM